MAGGTSPEEEEERLTAKERYKVRMARQKAPGIMRQYCIPSPHLHSHDLHPPTSRPPELPPELPPGGGHLPSTCRWPRGRGKGHRPQIFCPGYPGTGLGICSQHLQLVLELHCPFKYILPFGLNADYKP